MTDSIHQHLHNDSKAFSITRMIDRYHREALLSAACVLVCLGTIPLWSRLTFKSGGEETFDHVTMAIAGAFSIFGVQIAVFSCLAIPPRATIFVIRALKVPLGMVTAAALVMIYSYVANDKAAMAWQASTPPDMDTDDEAEFAKKINHALCAKLGHLVCSGTMADAADLFQFHDGQDSTLGVQEACRSADGLHKSSSASDLCRACHSIPQLHLSKKDAIAVKSTAFTGFSLRERHWCGDYLINGNSGDHLQDSPYYQHRFELRQFWESVHACTLLIGAQLLGLLSCCSVTVIVMLQWWERNQSTVVAADTAALAVDSV